MSHAIENAVPDFLNVSDFFAEAPTDLRTMIDKHSDIILPRRIRYARFLLTSGSHQDVLELYSTFVK